jgi:esterase/lipase
MNKKKDKTPFLLKVIRWAYPKAELLAPPLAYRFFFTLFFTPLRYTTPDKERKAESFGERFTLQVENKTVQGYTWGNSPRTVILIHGWAGRSTQFRRFIIPLQEAGFKVVGFDGPAHGNSEGRSTNIIEFERVLKLLYEKFGTPEAIIAHSFGGGVALYSAMNGLPVKTLVNIASPTIGDEIINTYLRAIGGTEKTKIAFKRKLFRQYHKHFDEFTSLHALKNLHQSINLMLVYDEDDKEVNMKHALAVVELYPQATLHKTRGLGHTRILNDDRVIEEIVTYIQRHTSAAQNLQ